MKITFSVGIGMLSLCPGRLEQETHPITKYREDNGQPYSVDKYKYFASLANGQRFEIGEKIFGNGCDTSKMEEYFKKLGFDCIGKNFFYGVAGIKLKEIDGSTSYTLSAEVPDTDGLNVMITNVREMFKTAGFSNEILDMVKLHVTVY